MQSPAKPGYAACSTGNKLEELEDSGQVKSYELSATTGTHWDEFYDWSAVVDGYKVLRSDRQRRGERVVLHAQTGIA